MSLPLVSVILTSFNQRDLFERAYSSIVKQIYTNIEIIIVDDQSTDGSPQVIEKVIKQWGGNVHIFHHKKNVGVASSRNTGFKNACGDLLTYLDGDDYYYPEKISKEVNILMQNPLIDVVYSNFEIINEISGKNTLWNENKDIMPTGNVFKELLFDEFPYHIDYRCELMKRSVLEKINYYDVTLKRYSDYDMRLRYSVDHNVAYCDYVGSVYVRNNNSISIKNSTQYQVFKDSVTVKKKNQWLLKNLKNANATSLMKTLDKKIEYNTLCLSQHNFAYSLIHAVRFLIKYPYEYVSLIKFIKWRMSSSSK